MVNMRTSSVLSLSTLIAYSLAAAVPYAKRGEVIDWVTVSEQVVVTEDVTTTVYVDAATINPAVATGAASTVDTVTSDGAQFYKVQMPVTATSSPTSAPSSSSSSPAAAPPSSSSSSSAAPVAQPTTSTQAAAPAVQSSSTPASSSTPSSSGGTSTGSAGGAVHSGDMTYYTAGLGSCGWTNDGDSEDVVALAHNLYESPPAGDPANPCGHMISITHNGKTITAKVVDKCMGCVGDSIDLSTHAFDQLEAESVGRTTCTWEYIS